MVGNPIKANQVYFWQRGQQRVGWIAKSTPTRYLIDYGSDRFERRYLHVWRRKQDVQFVTTGKMGSVKRSRKPKNPCPWPPRKNVSRGTVEQAARLSKRFHGLRPRRLSGVRITWPKALTLIGQVVRLDYMSDKEDGKQRIYTHDFDRPAQVFASGSARSGQKNILILHGSFAITEKGIVG